MTLPLWMFVLILALTAVVSAIVSSVAGYHYLRRSSTKVAYSESNVTDEILELKGKVALIYASGPLTALLLLILGIQGYENARALVGEGVVAEAVAEYEEQRDRFEALAAQLENYSGYVQQSQLARYVTFDVFNERAGQHATNADLRARITQLESDLTVRLGDYVTDTTMDNALERLVTAPDLRVALAEHPTRDELEDATTDVVTRGEFMTALGGRVTDEVLDIRLRGFVGRAEWNNGREELLRRTDILSRAVDDRVTIRTFTDRLEDVVTNDGLRVQLDKLGVTDPGTS